MIKFNKAIRDKIPEIMEQFDNHYKVKTLSDVDFLEKLEEKLSEEVAEYLSDKNPEELADILEVINRIVELKGISKEELDQIRIKKLKERGGFKDNLFLIDTASEQGNIHD